jgi:glycerol-3-phosphate acyltransferase PlsY
MYQIVHVQNRPIAAGHTDFVNDSNAAGAVVDSQQLNGYCRPRAASNSYILIDVATATFPWQDAVHIQNSDIANIMDTESVRMQLWLWLMPVVAYLVGSFSFAWLAGRLNGIDLRAHGSRSLGATNAGRVLGITWFFLVFAFDVVKGWAPVIVVDRALHPGGNTLLLMAVGVSAVLGHVFTCYHGFRGGKAVATSLGVLVALLPLVAAFSFAVWSLVLLAQWAIPGRSRSDSVGPASIAAAIAAPIIFLVLTESPWKEPELPITVFIFLLSMLVVLKHHRNIAKLLGHT